MALFVFYIKQINIFCRIHSEPDSLPKANLEAVGQNVLI